MSTRTEVSLSTLRLRSPKLITKIYQKLAPRGWDLRCICHGAMSMYSYDDRLRRLRISSLLVTS